MRGAQAAQQHARAEPALGRTVEKRFRSGLGQGRDDIGVSQAATAGQQRDEAPHPGRPARGTHGPPSGRASRRRMLATPVKQGGPPQGRRHPRTTPTMTVLVIRTAGRSGERIPYPQQTPRLVPQPMAAQQRLIDLRNVEVEQGSLDAGTADCVREGGPQPRATQPLDGLHDGGRRVEPHEEQGRIDAQPGLQSRGPLMVRNQRRQTGETGPVGHPLIRRQFLVRTRGGT
ncbi:hypothetical protein ABZX98_32485 [Streptomyces sp. NPDC002992]|uniref:hypothetical protein n=1 Tax=Streptomyces sp. NPDC002992 TaxID=3154273 RepID=UPI0033ADD5C6